MFGISDFFKSDYQPLNYANVKQLQNLHTQSKKTFAKLLSLDQESARIACLSSLALQLLNKPKDWPSINWRQFSHTHTGSLIRQTSLEGGNVQDSIAMWRSILTLWKKKKGIFFSLDLTHEHIGRIQRALDDLEFFSLSLPRPAQEPLANEALEQLAIQFQKTLFNRLKERQVVYLHLGYRFGMANDGHSIPCKMIWEEDGVVIYLLNSGEGSETHPILNFTTTQEKRAFCYYPIKVPHLVMWQKLGLTAISHLIRYLIDPPNPNHPPYRGCDIYDLFKTLGTVMPNLKRIDENFEAKDQISGICSEKGVKNVIRDVLIYHSLIAQQIKKVFLNYALCSLISGFHEFRLQPTFERRVLMKSAQERFGLHLEKFKSKISQEEYLAAFSVCSEIKNQIQKPAIQEIEQKKEQKSTRAETVPSCFTDVKQEDVAIDPLKTNQVAKKVYPSVSHKFEIKNFDAVLDEWILCLEQLDPKEALTFFIKCAKSLPIPKWREKDLWDHLSQGEAEKILIKFERLLPLGLKGESREFRRPIFLDTILAVQTFYCVAEKLARMNEKTKLSEFALPLVTQVYSFSPSNFTSIPLGEENIRYSQILSYFKDSFEEAEGKVIFPIHPVLPVEAWVQKLTEDSSNSQGLNHLLFLRQHIYEKYPESSNTKMTPIYSYIWKNQKEELPREIYSLYYFVYVIHILYFGGSTESVPEELEFAEGFDESGRKALILDSEEKGFLLSHPDITSMKSKRKSGKISFAPFSEMEITYHFLPLMNETYESLNTNDAVCARFDDSRKLRFGISEAIFRDLLRITRQNALKLPLAVQWAETHYVYLDHPGIQKILDHCFFNPGGLCRTLEETPTYINVLRNFIARGLDYYRDNSHHLSTVLFLIRTGICFEQYDSYLHGKKGMEDQFTLYENRLEKLLKDEVKEIARTEILWHWLFLQVHLEPEKLSELFFHRAFELCFLKRPRILTESRGDSYQQEGVNYRWLIRKLPQLIQDQIFEYKSCSGKLNRVCSSLITHFLPQYDSLISDTEWNFDKFPYVTFQDFFIDFAQLKLGHIEKGELHELRHLTAFPGWEQMKKEFGVHFWKRGEWQEAFFESLDGRLQVGYTIKSEMVFEREIFFEGKKRMARLHHLKELKKNHESLAFLNDSWDEKFPYLHFKLIDNNPDNPGLVTYNYMTNEPVFRIDFPKTGGWQITRLDQMGKTLPICLANLEGGQNQDHPLVKHVLRYAQPKDLLCFVNRKFKVIEELNFHRLNLQFKRDPNHPEGRLEAKQLPGFYLNLEGAIEELNGLQSAFLLTNSTGEKQVILPLSCLRNQGAFSRDIEFEDRFLLKDENDKAYSIYQIDPCNGTLLSKKPIANLYLALLFKTQRDYSKALKYLMQARSNRFFNSSEEALFEEIAKISDHSPEAHGFHMKLFYLWIENHNLMLESRFKDDSLATHPFLERGIRVYLDYLKVLNNDDLSSIPKELRLEIHQEQAILQTISRYIKKEYIPRVLKIRFQVLSRETDMIKIGLSNQISSRRPQVYEKLLMPKDSKIEDLRLDSLELFLSGKKGLKKLEDQQEIIPLDYFNRISAFAFRSNFTSFYEIARKCDPKCIEPFDFTLLSLLKSDIENGEAFVSLLFYVRYFPQEFRELSLANLHQLQKQELKNIWNKIIDGVQKLDKTESFQSFKTKYLEEKQEFAFQKEVNLSLRQEEIPFKVKLSKTNNYEAQPFLAFRNYLFSKTKRKIDYPEDPPFIDAHFIYPDSSLEAELISRLKAGYEKLKKKTTSSFTLYQDKLKTVQEPLSKAKKGLHDELVKMREMIILKLNASYTIRGGALTPESLNREISFRMQQAIQQTITLLPENVMKESVLKNDPAFISKNAPLLSPDEVKEVMYQVCDYYHHLAVFQLFQEVESLVQKLMKEPNNANLTKELAEKLNYKFRYNPIEYPEISYFKVTEGKLPRPDQVNLYFWICEGLSKGENRLFQHPAGGGKTDYIAPLVMLRAKRLGLTPVYLSTPMIYSVDRENLSFTLKKLQEDLAYLEIGLHMKLSAENLKFIFEELEIYRKDGRKIILVPQTLFALILQYVYAGTKEEDIEKVKWLSLILDFFRTKTLLIGDESHKNCDPLTRAIYGVGENFKLPKQEIDLLLSMLKSLLGFELVLDKHSKPISQVTRLEKNQIGKPSEEEIASAQKALAFHMSQSAQLNIPPNEREAIALYWTDKGQTQPKWLKELSIADREKAGLISLTGYFILDLLPEIVHLRTELNHGPSGYPEEEFDTPYHHKTPSNSQYENSYLTAAVSAKGTAHRGLSDIQICNLVKKLLDEDWEEQKEKRNVGTKSAALFKKWVENTPLQNKHLHDISLSNPKMVQQVCEVLSKLPNVIDYYLSTFIFPQIGYSLEQLTVTPAHLVNCVKQAILFSATPSSSLIYPDSIDAVLDKPEFEAEVVAQLCHEKNQQRVLVKSPETFFAEMSSNLLFQKTGVLIDPSGFFCDFRNEEIAKQWLKHSSLDGILYFREGKTLKVDKEEKISLLLKSDPETPLELKGSDIQDALKEMGLDWGNLNLGTYYDASHTESANITQKDEAQAFLLLADHLTTSRLIQAIMRLRGFLDSKKDQKIVWVFPEELENKIRFEKKDRLDGAAIFSWSLKNEVLELRKRVILAAFQEISFQIEKIAWGELQEYLHDPDMQVQLMRKYRQGFLEIHQHDPYGKFANHEIEQDVKDVLTDFAAQSYARFGYAISFEENQQLQRHLVKIIQKVSKKIQKISTHWERKASFEVEQQVHLQKELEQTHYAPRPFDPLAAEGTYGTLSVLKPNYFDNLNRISSRKFFKAFELTERLFLEVNQYTTAKNAGISLRDKYLKPIDFFLILLEKNKEPVAIAHANEIVASTKRDLIKGTDDPLIEHKAFLVTASGHLFQSGHGRLAPSKEQIQEILDSDWMQNLVLDAALLKGQVVHKELLEKRLKGWKTFPEFWDRIIAAQPNPEVCDKSAISKILNKPLQTD